MAHDRDPLGSVQRFACDIPHFFHRLLVQALFLQSWQRLWTRREQRCKSNPIGKLAVSMSFRPGSPAFAQQDPDLLSSVDDVLNRRRLLPVDDFVLSHYYSGTGVQTSGLQENIVLQTAGSAISGQQTYSLGQPVTNAPNLVTAVGRMFNLPYDVVATLHKSAATGKLTVTIQDAAK
jgi:hypothetical protein